MVPTRVRLILRGGVIDHLTLHAANATHCERVKPFLDKLQELQTDMTNVLADAMLSIERLVPHTSMAHSAIHVVGYRS